ncbi:MAG: hypothetical protein ACXWMN_01030 [Candidatus Limnocylindria bacterium]
MTMQNLPHPDDELLAAYAGGDRDALADASLVAHLSACDRCRPLVDELSLLRGALAELPDIAPSRPLRLIPPVPAPAAPAVRGSWLRRLTAPAMAAGAVLILVGAVGIGATGAIGSFFGQAASRVFENVGDDLQGVPAPQSEAAASDGAFQPVPGAAGSPSATSRETKGSDSAGSGESPGARFSPRASPTAAPSGSSEPQHANQGSSPEQPWLALLIAGASLLVVSAGLRFSLSPRAG